MFNVFSSIQHHGCEIHLSTAWGHSLFICAASPSVVWLDHNVLICHLLIVIWGYYQKKFFLIASVNILVDAHRSRVLLTLSTRRDLWIRGHL